MKKTGIILMMLTLCMVLFAEVSQSTITTTTTEYSVGFTGDITFNVNFASDDYEFMDGLSLTFPSGVNVNSATATDWFDYNNETGDGATITWGETVNASAWGEDVDTDSFSVNLTIATDFSGDMIIDWTIYGDGAGASAPHTVSGNIAISAGEEVETPEVTFGLNASTTEDNRISLDWGTPNLSSNIFSDNFDTYADGQLDVGEWTMVDVDQGTTVEFIDQDYYFPNAGVAYAWTIATWSNSNVTPHSAPGTIASLSNMGGVQNNDWLITPALDLTDASCIDAGISFWVNPIGEGISTDPEYVNVLVSTTGQDTEDFTAIENLVLTEKDVWLEVELALTDYIGEEIYVAIQYASNSNVCVAVDDFKAYTYEYHISSYNVYRSLTNDADTFVLLAQTEDTNYIDFAVNPAVDYYYAVSANLSNGGETNLSNIATGQSVDYTVNSFPYMVDFDGLVATELPGGWSVSNDNSDDQAWGVNEGAGYSEPNCMKIRYHSDNAADDWFYAAPVSMIEGVSYDLAFRYRGNYAQYTEKLEVKAGLAPTAEAMNFEVFYNDAINSDEYAYAQVVFIAPTTADYTFGWHCFSDANQAALYVDDVFFDSAPTTPLFAVSQDTLRFDETFVTEFDFREITVTNIGIGELNVNSLLLTDNFAVNTDVEFPVLLGEDEEFTFNVSFIPTEDGDLTGSLTINHSEPEVQTEITLIGSAIDATLTAPFVEGFVPPAGSQNLYLPENWRIFKGYLAQQSNLIPSNELWSCDDYANVVKDPVELGVSVNVGGQYLRHWLMAPPIDLGEGTDYQLELDVALTERYVNGEVQLDSDDKVAVVISLDNGVTWSQNNVLQMWSSSDVMSHLGEHKTIDLSAYSGMIQLAFYAESTTSNENEKEIFFDNVAITELGHVTQVGTPTVDLDAGEYYGPQTVHFDSAILGATYYYTVDGSVPDETSLVYADSMVVEESLTLNLYAVKENMSDSELTTVTYTIIPLSNEEVSSITQTRLFANYPNPFNPETTISFDMKEAGKVEINIYNVKGQQVKTVVNKDMKRGHHEIVWNGKDDNNKSVASGVYFYKMQTKSYTAFQKAILLK